MGVELFAINQVLHWLILNQPITVNQDVVILTDSMSGMRALGNHHKRSYSSASNQIVSLANILKDNLKSLTIQWVPSHVGVCGNEKADDLAKSAHTLPRLTDAPLDILEMKAKLKATLKRRCQLKYDLARQNTHIGDIKSKLEPWPWVNMKSRRSETAMARLRIGHSRLKAHLHKFGLAASPNCTVCATPEDTKHILEDCLSSRAHRNILHWKLRRMGIQVHNSKILLGGGDYEHPIQCKILEAVEQFLANSGYLEDI